MAYRPIGILHELTCAWCRKTFRVRTCKRGIAKYCSRSCGARATWKRKNQLTTEIRRKGAIRSAEIRRAQALAKLKDLTPVEIYRKGYAAGWHRGVRYARGVQAAREVA